jgi:hypothetical protein
LESRLPQVYNFVSGSIGHNGLQAFSCFALSDYLVQFMVKQKSGQLMVKPKSDRELDKAEGAVLGGRKDMSLMAKEIVEILPELNVWRSVRAGCLGVGINGCGYSFFIAHLDNVFPHEGEQQGMLELAGKVFTDSFVWGTISNSLNIFGRGLLEGESAALAFETWRAEIQEVTFNEFQFWPLWNLVNFHLVPRHMRVSFGAFGVASVCVCVCVLNVCIVCLCVCVFVRVNLCWCMCVCVCGTLGMLFALFRQLI